MLWPLTSANIPMASLGLEFVFEFEKLSGVAQQPAIPYAVVDCKDPVDVRLEEFYNST